MPNWKWGWVLLGALVAAVWVEFTISRRNVPGPSATSNPAPPSLSTTGPAEVLLPPEPANDDTLVRDLGSGEERVRLAAQQSLAGFPWPRRAYLQRLIDECSDEAVKAQLTHRLDEIEGDLTLYPPRISLHVKDASLFEVITALNMEMNARLQAGAGAGPNLYTVDAENKTLWEIFTRLNAQHPLMLLQPAEGLTILEADRPVQYRIAEPFIFGARVQTIGMANPGPGQPPPRESLWFVVALDPRASFTGASFGLKIGPDDLGNELWPAGQSGMEAHQMTGTGFHEGRVLHARFPGATRVASAVATLRAQAVLESVRATVDNVEAGFTARVENLSVTGRPFDEGGGRITATFTAAAADGPPATVMYQLIDAAGVVRTTTSALGTTTIAWSGAMEAPYRLRIRVPTSTREFNATFAVKDLPMP